MSDCSDRIAKRAYELFTASGFTHGHDLEDWFKAEHELFDPMNLQIGELEHEFVVKAEVPGFVAKDLDVYVNGNHLIIEGQHEALQQENGKDAAAHNTSFRQVYRAIELPSAVFPQHSHAELKSGVLELKLPKIPKKQIRVAAA
jgi:HSP20 family protein